MNRGFVAKQENHFWCFKEDFIDRLSEFDITQVAPCKMNDLVEKALKLARDKESATSSALVVRPLDLMFDLGNMLTWSENEIEVLFTWNIS